MQKSMIFLIARSAFVSVGLAVCLQLPIGRSQAFAVALDISSIGLDDFKTTPVTFTENRGQWDSEVLFRASSGDVTMWFTGDGIYYQFPREKASGLTADQAAGQYQPAEVEQIIVKATFVGSHPDPTISREGLTDYRCNYFLGNDRSRWQVDVPNYEGISYHNLYDGIDLSLRAAGNSLEARITIAPGADAQQMRLQFEGVKSLNFDVRGNLVLETPFGELVERTPVIYQEISGARQHLTGGYELLDSNSLHLVVRDSYDTNSSLIIVPTLTFSTYLGGGNGDDAFDIATNVSGEAFVTGATSSADFPQVNAFDISVAGFDGFVSKFNASGSGLVFSTYLGGSGLDRCTAMSFTYSTAYAVFLTGFSDSPDFPTANAVDATPNGSTDGFVAVLNSTGNGLTVGTYLGGSGLDLPGDIDARCIFPCAIDRFNVWVTGYTYSTNFPTNNGYSSSLSGPTDAFLTQYTIGITGNSMGRSTYFGGSGSESGRAIVMTGNSSGRPAIAGDTRSADLPTLGAYDATLNASCDAFVAEFDYTGTNPLALVFSTYFGGSSSTDDESAYSILVRSNGNLTIVGRTPATDLPIVGGFDNSYNGGSLDGFIAEFNSIGSTLIYSSYLGGNGSDVANKITLDRLGDVYLIGETRSTNFPMTNAYDASLSGTSDAFITKFNSSMTTLQFSTYLGGTSSEYGTGIAVDTLGCIYATGLTSSTDFPVANAYDAVGSGGDAFVTKICPPAYACGDANGDGIVNISDAVYLVSYIFAGGPAPSPLATGDANCDGLVNISDAVYLISYIFSGGPAPCASCP